MLNIIENFPILFDSKEKVKELRNLILTLAVQGKLVPQDPGDEPASVLLQRIEAEKKRLVKEKKIKRTKSLPPIGEDEIPFEIPESWIFVRLGSIGDWGSGATPSRSNVDYYNNGTMPWLKTGELNDGYINSSEEYITEKAVKETSVRLNQPGDVLIAMYGATIGRLAILEIKATTNQACCACTPFKGVFNRYLFYYLLSQRNNFKAQGAGGAQPNISKEKIVKYIFPLPPLSEQYRIVQKIDELMGLCDELEKALEKKAQSKELGSKSISNLIQKSENQEQLKANLTLLINMFKEVYSTKANIKDLRDTILQLATQGKLVPQDPNDEPASVLLKRIEEEKKKLIKEKKIRKETPLPPISKDEWPFELPNGWEWVRLSEICYNHGQKKPSVKFTYIDVSSINNEKGELAETLNELLPEEAPSRARKIVKQGSIIYSTVRPYLLNIAIIDREFQYEPIVSTAFAVIHPFKGVYNRYLFYYLRGIEFNRFVESQMVGMAYPAINDARLFKGLVPLPPLLEQHRIVQKIDELMALCDELENHLKNTVHHSDDLMKAIIKTAI